MTKEYGTLKGPYTDTSIKKRIEKAFLDNVGKVLTRQLLLEVARDPITKEEPENWHQRLSELRTDSGYTILSKRDRPDLEVGEYLLVSAEKRAKVNKRIYPSKSAWNAALKRANHQCEWAEGGQACGLREGDIDPVGGGTVKLTPDHKSPHSIGTDFDADNPDDWQVLCGRHQVQKKNYWDNKTGKLNTIAILQAIPEKEKKLAYEFLQEYFKYKKE